MVTYTWGLNIFVIRNYIMINRNISQQSYLRTSGQNRRCKYQTFGVRWSINKRSVAKIKYKRRDSGDFKARIKETEF